MVVGVVVVGEVVVGWGNQLSDPVQLTAATIFKKEKKERFFI